MKSGFGIKGLIVALAGVVGLAFANEDAAKEAPPESVRSVVQTAGWAVEWWMPRHEEKLNRIKQGKIDLLMIGDSITHSWETRGRKVWDKYYKHRNAANLGFSGDRTEHVLWRLQNGEIKGLSPRVVILMIGTNNAGHRKEASEDTAAGIKAIVEELKTRLPNTRILLLAIFPRGAAPDDELRRLNDGTNKIVAGLADNKRVFYLDINDTFLDDSGNLPKTVMPDLLHPNEHGYELWAKAMESTLSKLMQQPAPEAVAK